MEWHIINSSELDIYGEEILKMYEKSYKDIGLIDFGGWDGMKKYLNCSCYLLQEKKQIMGIILYWLSDFGNKISLVISSDSDTGKAYVIPKLIELLSVPGFYVELSDALEYLVRKSGLDNIKDNEIIKKLIPQILDKDIFTEGDARCIEFPLNKLKGIPSPAGSFLREIKDIGIHRKALYGKTCLNKKYSTKVCSRVCVLSGGRRTTKKIHKIKFNKKQPHKTKKNNYNSGRRA